MHRKRTLLFALVILVVATVGARADEVDDFVKAEMQRRHIPGTSIAVLKDGKIIKAQGYGLANVELNVPAIASSKMKKEKSLIWWSSWRVGKGGGQRKSSDARLATCMIDKTLLGLCKRSAQFGWRAATDDAQQVLSFLRSDSRVPGEPGLQAGMRKVLRRCT